MAFDLKTGEDFDLVIQDGDILFEDGITEDVRWLAASSKGDWKYSLLAGLGVHRYLNARFTKAQQNALASQVRRQLYAFKIPYTSVTVSAEGTVRIK